jgi:hypothetical protein
MSGTFKTAAFTMLFAAGLGLTACDPDLSGIDPKVIEQLKTPCNGTFQSNFEESATGWTVKISCVSKEKLEKQKKDMFEGLERTEPRKDGHNPLNYQ